MLSGWKKVPHLHFWIWIIYFCLKIPKCCITICMPKIMFRNQVCLTDWRHKACEINQSACVSMMRWDSKHAFRTGCPRSLSPHMVDCIVCFFDCDSPTYLTTLHTLPFDCKIPFLSIINRQKGSTQNNTI